MKLIVGLGNPGSRYKKTRHNAGFIVLDKFLKYLIEDGYNFNKFIFDKDTNSDISNGIINTEKILLIKPQTYMNKSGDSVKKLLDYYKLNPQKDLIVIYDDIDIIFSKLKTTGLSSGGHKGLQSIIDSTGSNNIKRIRIGILGKPKDEIANVSDYVLSNFTPEEYDMLNSISKDAFSYTLNEFIKNTVL